MISRFQGQDDKPRLITALRSLADAAQLIQVRPASPNSEIIKQGATDNDIHIILSGLVSVRINGREVARRSASHLEMDFANDPDPETAVTGRIATIF